MIQTAATLLRGFRLADAARAGNVVQADALRAERDFLMNGWDDLIRDMDHDELARRSIRVGEINRELTRLA